MGYYIIEGKNKLSGEISVNGAKNSALKIIPASLLSKQSITIYNCPDIEDVKRLLEIIKEMGANVRREGGVLKIDSSGIKDSSLNIDLAKTIRSSVLLISPLLARFGHLYLPHPGGCILGKRPIDIFISGLATLGVETEDKGDGYYFKTKGLRGGYFFFPLISVTATESLLMAAVLAKGTSVLENCACEPEILALAEYLNTCGAKIKGAGTHRIEIEGVAELGAGTFEVIPDRIEAASFAIMAAATSSHLKVTDCCPDHLRALWSVFDKIGVKYVVESDYVEVFPRDNVLSACDIKTHEYPGFATDFQAPMVVLLTQCCGASLVHETIFDRRLFYTDMLNQMGADIFLADPHRVVVNGQTALRGRKVISPDLRAGIAMLIAGLTASGQTKIENIYQIERGYANIVERLSLIGADIKKYK